jgi:hypothetical protein
MASVEAKKQLAIKIVRMVSEQENFEAIEGVESIGVAFVSSAEASGMSEQATLEFVSKTWAMLRKTKKN